MIDEIAPLDLIEDGEVNVCTTTDDNVPSHTKFTKLKFKNSEDFLAEFPIPAKIQRIEVTVTGKIKIQGETEKEYIKLKDTHTINYELHKGDGIFSSVYL